MNTTIDHDLLLQEYIDNKRTEYIPVFVFYGCIILFGIIGNSFGFYFYRFKATKTVSSLLLASLAANDLLTSIVLFDKLYQLYKIGDFTNSSVCRILIFVNHVFVLNSGFIIIAMNIDRFQHVCFPFSKYGFSRRSAKICVLILILLSSAISTSNLLLTNSVKYEITMNLNTTIVGHRCTHSRKEEHQTAITVFHFVDLFAVTLTIFSAIIIYSVIACKISKYKRDLKTLSQHSYKVKGFCDKSCAKGDNNNVSSENKNTQNINRTDGEGQTTNIINIATNDRCKTDTADPLSANPRATDVECQVSQQPKFTPHGDHHTRSNSRKQTSEVRITAMMFTMTLGTALCVVPYFYISLVQHPGMTKDEFELSAKARLLRGSFAVYSTLNPYVIGVFHTEFRAFTVNFIKSIFCCCFRRQT